MRQAGWSIEKSNVIRICDKTFKFSKSREIEGVIKTVTIKRDTLGDLYIFFAVHQSKPESIFKSGKSVGMDFGLKTFLTVNEDWGKKEAYSIESPLFFKQNRKMVVLKNKKVSSKRVMEEVTIKGKKRKRMKNVQSQNYYKALLDLTRTYKFVANKRRDWMFKLAKTLCEQNDYIFIEDLCMKGMQRLWGRKVSDLGFSEFVKILESQGRKYFCVVHKIGRFKPSTKECYDCGFIKIGRAHV